MSVTLEFREIFDLLPEWQQDDFLKDVLTRIGTRRHAMILIESADMDAINTQIADMMAEEAM